MMASTHSAAAGAGGPTIRLGVSACLLGQEVRFDGGHKRDPFLVKTLGAFVEWVPVCPEMEIGLGTPRESVRLVRSAEGTRLVAPRSGLDHTEAMERWARSHLDELARLRLHGFVLKKDSPSCGLFRVRLYSAKGQATRDGRGLFARELLERFKLLPAEEEGRLQDMPLRENFLERVFAYERWLRLLEEHPTPRGLVAFHTVHKLAVMSHSPAHYQRLGRLVARAGKTPWRELEAGYGELFMEALAVRATRGKHVNVLQHLAGFVSKAMGKEDRRELEEAISDYRSGHVPLIVPLTLLRHHLRRHEAPPWALEQVYIAPYPKELMLRNHV
jgi:uncharacterized protein YbgA (DUF1722 family)/uncharacterized protein YbbK (DUF523 family)